MQGRTQARRRWALAEHTEVVHLRNVARPRYSACGKPVRGRDVQPGAYEHVCVTCRRRARESGVGARWVVTDGAGRYAAPGAWYTTRLSEARTWAVQSEAQAWACEGEQVVTVESQLRPEVRAAFGG